IGVYYESEIKDISWDEEKGIYHSPCPCGDHFEISQKQLANSKSHSFAKAVH
ncbi:hypothetical protein OG21DRAFT_1571979, partial [Imleria badia]